MNSDSDDNEGFYQGRYLPERLAERAATVTDDPMQLSLSSFRSPEALTLCKMARMDLISAREIHTRAIRQAAQNYPSYTRGFTDDP
jgi:hypothetical protein